MTVSSETLFLIFKLNLIIILFQALRYANRPACNFACNRVPPLLRGICKNVCRVSTNALYTIQVANDLSYSQILLYTTSCHRFTADWLAEKSCSLILQP